MFPNRTHVNSSLTNQVTLCLFKYFTLEKKLSQRNHLSTCCASLPETSLYQPSVLKTRFQEILLKPTLLWFLTFETEMLNNH